MSDETKNELPVESGNTVDEALDIFNQSDYRIGVTNISRKKTDWMFNLTKKDYYEAEIS